MDGDGSGAAMSAPAARRNPDWQDLDPEENERNRRQLDGFTRIFPDGRTRVCRAGRHAGYFMGPWV